MQRLLLATDSFPYGNAERTFVLPELIRLREHYDITVISHADRKQTAEDIIETEIPEGVKAVHFPRPVITFTDKVKACILFLADREGRQEIKEILAEKKNIKERLYQSLSFFAQTLSDQKMLEKSGLLTKDEPFLYYSFWYTYFCYSMIRLRHKYPDVKIVTRVHGHDLYHERVPGCRQPFKHQMENGLEKIIFACEFGRNYYVEKVKAIDTDAAKIRVCRLGTAPAARRMPVTDMGEWQLVSCSNVVPLKRIERIIDGLSQIADYKINWTHIGDGSELVHIQEYAKKKLDTKSNIRYTFTGYLRDVSLFYEQNQADCFITTSSTEGGCPLSIQEAMSYGVPVIGTDVGGITEMIGDNGLLLSADPDGTEVADAIETIAGSDMEKQQTMKDNSYARWKQEFDVNDLFKLILRELQECSNAV